jgi:threonine aldolase
MRQVGVLAAAARVALTSGVERLAEDHANARRLAQGLAELHPEAVDLAMVETNMVYLNVRPFAKDAVAVSAELEPHGVMTAAGPGYSLRLVTHKDVSQSAVDRALVALKKVLLQP